MSNKIRKIAGLGLIVAIECILCLIANILPNTGTNLNLGLVPIVIASIIYGPIEGMIVGVVNGIFNIVSPVNIIFINETLIGTIICCITKTALAGLVSGFIFKGFKEKKKLGVLICSIAVVFVNTLIFVLFASLIYQDLFNEEGKLFINLILIFISVNFLIEISTSLVLSNAIYRIIYVKSRREIK